MSTPTPGSEYDLVGFAITPSRPLEESDKERLDLDIGSLLASLAFPPPGIVDLAFDLRYLAINDTSITGRQLTVALLCRLNYEPDLKLDQKKIISDFNREFSDLLRLHLDPYGYRVRPIDGGEIWNVMAPFEISDYVELTRRITKLRPLQMSRFQGRSPMSRTVDMLLRQKSQVCLSIYLEPHPLSADESRELESFGYETDVLGEDRDVRDLRALLSAEEPNRLGTTTPFRVSLRIVSEDPISQYLINLVGAEISGRRDYTFFRPDPSQLDSARSALKDLYFFTTNNDPALADIPDALRNLVHIFQVGEAQAAFRLPTERIATSRERTFETYPAPVANMPKTGLMLGDSEHPSHSMPLPVHLQKSDRRRHVYIVGKTGTGKSMLLLNMMIQDLEKGAGLCLIDPHGDLVNTLAKHIPANRTEDVVVFDPADSEFAAGLNFLDASKDDAAEKDFLTQEVISMILRMVDFDIAMYGPVGQQMTRMACATLMELEEPATLIEVPLIFSSPRYRRHVLSRIDNPELLRWWQEEWEAKTEYQKQEVLAWFTSKFEQFASAPSVRNVVGQAHSTFNIKEIMDNGGILLVNVSRGRLGALNSSALGGIIVSKLLWAATRRAWDPEESRKDFYLYVDEFQNFISDSFETILSEARKYRLNLIVAHQHIGQLKAMGNLSDRIERAVFGNIGTMVTFRVGTDAHRLAEELGAPVQAHALRALENRYCVSQLLVDDVPTVPFTMKTADYKTPGEAASSRAADLFEQARKRNRPVPSVLEEIAERHTFEQ